jgi:WD40 repeat protein
MSPDGRFVASLGGGEGTWKLWDAARGVVCMTGDRHDGTGACICGPGHRSLEACPVVAHTDNLRTLTFSPCGKRLATGGKDFAVILWDAQTGKAELVFKGCSECSV